MTCGGYNSKSSTYNYDPMYRATEPYFTGHQFDGSLNIYYADHRFYDAEGNQLTAVNNKGKTFRFEYDANGNMTAKWYPNGELERYQYDAAGRRVRLDEYAVNGVQKTYTEYTYDENGNRTGDKNRVPTEPARNYAYLGNTGAWGGDWNTYAYDALNRLMLEYEHDTHQSVLYAYDALGNRVLEKDNRDTLHYTYNELNQLVQKKAFNGISTYEYDKRGNRILETSEHTQENRRTMTWDAANRLVSGARGTDWSLYKSEYTYNGLGMRVNSTIEGPEHTIYDRDYLIDYTSPERNDLAEYNVGHYQWQGTKKVHDLKYLYTADGQRLEVDALHYSQWGGSDTRYTLNIHENIMGSAVAYTYQGGWNDGQWANKHEFDVWGYNSKSPTYNYDPMYRATEPYFTGHQFDGSLNIYYADHRFYDAETGIWLSPDPIKDGLNWYTYCENNPVTNVDPTGLWAQMSAVSMQEKYKAPLMGYQIPRGDYLQRDLELNLVDRIARTIFHEDTLAKGQDAIAWTMFNRAMAPNGFADPDMPKTLEGIMMSNNGSPVGGYQVFKNQFNTNPSQPDPYDPLDYIKNYPYIYVTKVSSQDAWDHAVELAYILDEISNNPNMSIDEKREAFEMAVSWPFDQSKPDDENRWKITQYISHHYGPLPASNPWTVSGTNNVFGS